MQDFINYIVSLVNSIYVCIDDAFAYRWSNFYSYYRSFLDKNVFFENSFLGLNLTYFDLFTSVFVWVLVLTTIILFIKFICKIFSIFRV